MSKQTLREQIKKNQKYGKINFGTISSLNVRNDKLRG